VICIYIVNLSLIPAICCGAVLAAFSPAQQRAADVYSENQKGVIVKDEGHVNAQTPS
jgi:hypothetical protein